MHDPAHLFHIPVMGTGFTIDTPLKVARFGISSVISLVDDVLIEQMRKHHAGLHGEPYEEIGFRDPDRRARRITAYLDLLDRLVRRQVERLRAGAFEPGSEITKYFDLLPEGRRKTLYREMLAAAQPAEKARLQALLRQAVTPGSIDVNIMTKLDRDAYRAGEKLAPEFSDAMSALRGFARSVARSSVIFSAGMNPRLYSYAAQFDDFLPDPDGRLRKKIILKVSDFRSGEIQGKFLAKRGLWVSEYRIESGLNCGGHAFPTAGHLLGPILEEFRDRRDELVAELFRICNAALLTRGKLGFSDPPPMRVTVQGGIGTAAEQELLLNAYGADGTGWGTPFLLVPEVTNVDEAHLEKLIQASTEKDVYLSDHSPLGIPFWSLAASASEESRRRRIAEGKPGSPCPKGYLALNAEYTPVPICRASQAYQRLKLREIDAMADMPLNGASRDSVLRKSCICHDLAGGATLKNGIDPEATPAVCCGPNIVNFNRLASLREMVDHIYGRISLLASSERPHMFIKELRLYVDYLKQETHQISEQCSGRAREHLEQFKANLLQGVAHYHRLADRLAGHRTRFLEDLQRLRQEIEAIEIPAPSLLPNPA